MIVRGNNADQTESDWVKPTGESDFGKSREKSQ
jgi:hypothetical protein